MFASNTASLSRHLNRRTRDESHGNALSLRGVALVLALCGLLAASAFSQTGPTIRIQEIDQSGFPNIVLKVKYQQSRNSYKPFTPNDISFFEYGIPANYTLHCPENPIAVALVLDKSLSMAFYPNSVIVDPDSVRWRNAKAALIEYVNRMGDQDLAALIAFHGIINLHRDFTSNKEMLIGSINSIELGSGTALWLAGMEAIRRLKVRPERKAVILLTDGADNRSGRTLMRTVLDSAKKNGIPFYTVGLGEDVSQSSLDSLARYSGGRFFFTADGSDLASIYFDISQALAADCVIEYTTNSVCKDSSLHPVRVIYDNSFGMGSADSSFIAPVRRQYASVHLPPIRYIKQGQIMDLPVTFVNDSDEEDLTMDLVMEIDPSIFRFVGMRGVMPGASLRAEQSTVFRTMRISGTVHIPRDSSVQLCEIQLEAMPFDSSKTIALQWQDLSLSGICPILPHQLDGTTVLMEATCDRIVKLKPGARINSVFPNPSQESVTITYGIRSEETATPGLLSLQDAFGRTVISDISLVDSGSITIPVSWLPSGRYLLRFVHASGTDQRSIVITH